MMIQKETNQPDNTVVIENLITMSRDHQIMIRVDFRLNDHERRLVGILKDVVMVHNIPLLYLGRVVSGKDGIETHALIPVSTIESITFETEKGYLDNLMD